MLFVLVLFPCLLIILMLFVFLDLLTPDLVIFNILMHIYKYLTFKFQIEAHLDTLINEQASYVLTRAGLSYIYNSVQQHKPEQVRLYTGCIQMVGHTCLVEEFWHYYFYKLIFL